ncbi:MAG: SCP2 sterol-binding domain-containing protein [Anaerolineales bacterium]|jgi:putative sterol carrier protein
MAYEFPSEEWLREFVEVLNNDDGYARVAQNWEGSFLFVIEPDKGEEGEPAQLFMDLWHGKCRGWAVIDEDTADPPKPDFIMSAERSNFMKVLKGELDAVQAMLTRRLKLQGSLSYVMRNIPTVMDFVRCAKKVPIKGE